jgi:hypothetical protein
MPERTLSPELATNSTVTLGGFLYAVLCMPAINQRGYPPLDPIWDIIPFFWAAPLLLSGVFDTRPFAGRWRAIGAYALATAFFDSGTVPAVVPHQASVLVMLVETVLLYGPIHLVLGYGLEAIIQRVNRSRQAADPSGRHVGGSRLRWATFGVLVLATVSLPFVLRSMTFASIRNRAIERANNDWAAGKANVYSELPWQTIVEDGVYVESDYDQKTGLRLHSSDNIFGHRDTYNGRIAQLIAEHGVPDWSMARFVVKPADFLALLSSDGFVEVRQIPYDVSDRIRIYHKDAITQDGKPIGGDDKTIWIWTKPSGDRITRAGGTAYVGRSPKYPKMIFIRIDKSFIAAFREDGLYIAQAAKYEKRTP